MSITAAVAAAAGTTELRSFPEPNLRDDGGLLRIEAAGVCGSDVPAYRRIREPTILGHENVGRIEALGAAARERWGVDAGDRVVIEEYLPCGHCTYCRSGDFRLCDATDIWLGGIRYGSTPVSVAPALWGGFSRFAYLHPRSVLHRIADDVPAALATLAIPLSNGFEWAQREAQVAYGQVVVIQGPDSRGSRASLRPSSRARRASWSPGWPAMRADSRSRGCSAPTARSSPTPPRSRRTCAM